MNVGGESWRRAAQDVGGALSRPWLWTRLGWNDVRLRFSGSILGSFWIIANLSLMALALSLVFTGPLGTRWADYLPFVAIGLVLWQCIQGSLNEACNVFVVAAPAIRNSPLPLSIQVLRLLWRNLLILFHNVVVVIVLLAAFRVSPSEALWSVALALPLIAFALFWLCLLLGLLGARYRDVSQIVANLLQILFFLTPVFWPPQAIGPGRGWIVSWNPIFALIDVIRAPLLGTPVAASSWPMVLALSISAAACGFAALALARSRVAYWV